MNKRLLVFLAFILLQPAIIYKNGYSLNADNKTGQAVFEDIYRKSTEKEGVKEITYDQFMQIRNSGEKYILLDARSQESYDAGHIDTALSFSEKTINEENAKKELTKNSSIIVYCAGFECRASTLAAKKLSSLGYKAVDYKGGIKEWQEKGNKAIK